MPYPVLFESRRRSIQRFLLIPKLKIELLWFPIIKHIVRSYFKKTRTLILTIDRTQWRDKNIFVISLICDKRALPIFWQILPKKGSSNLNEQKKLIRPALDLFKNYKIIILGDREFGSVKLANWLCERNVKFALRVKEERYIKVDVLVVDIEGEIIGHPWLTTVIDTYSRCILGLLNIPRLHNNINFARFF